LEVGKKGGRRGVFEFFMVFWLSFLMVFKREKRKVLEFFRGYGVSAFCCFFAGVLIC